ncbi:uncharacterized protein Triagg1_9665 [Trichoderma aggressivum f. europaeum]|uniref:B3/B4 tRNA-binding domain-containing protein n=1 Tax=Trichoderma aggressivum f. europaeum TaxID=173218 RepID=A0AAE1LWB1_9HYPO|nr:hypothetical protein Triagg1_9665 [Trichoderma aggressivum f. europaeum]
MVIEGIPPGPGDDASETLLREAENSREAYKAFRAKPQKTRNSLEALTRRAEGGLPRVNRLTDIYNAISVKHQVHIGGEDLDKYNGSPFLTRASGQEQFETFSGGQAQSECAVPDDTTRVLFILDALEPLSDEALVEAAEELVSDLKQSSPEVQTARRIISASSSTRSGES